MDICSLTLYRIFLNNSVLLFQKSAIHSRYESHFGREAAQLCMIGCIAVLSHSHRHAFDLSPASKVLSKHCEESLSKCPHWHTSAAQKPDILQKNVLSTFFLYIYIRKEIRMHRKIKRINDVEMTWHIKSCRPWCVITI